MISTLITPPRSTTWERESAESKFENRLLGPTNGGAVLRGFRDNYSGLR